MVTSCDTTTLADLLVLLNMNRRHLLEQLVSWHLKLMYVNSPANSFHYSLIVLVLVAGCRDDWPHLLQDGSTGVHLPRLNLQNA